MQLPQEIIEQILIYHGRFELGVGFSDHVTKILFNPRMLSNVEWRKKYLKNINVLKFLHRIKEDGWTTYAANECARVGNLKNIKWILRHYPQPTTFLTGVLDRAAENNQVHVVDWLIESHNVHFSSHTLDCAVTSNNMDIVKFLYEKYIEQCRDNTNYANIFNPTAFLEAVKLGNLEMLNFITKTGIVCPEQALSIAAKYGHEDIIAFLLYKYPDTNFALDSMEQAATEGYLEVMKYLKSMNIKFNGHELKNAVYNGQLEVVKYLIDIGLKYKPMKLLNDAIEFGHIDIVKYLLEKHIKLYAAMKQPYHSGSGDIKYKIYEIATNALVNGNLEVVKFLNIKPEEIIDLIANSRILRHIVSKSHIQLDIFEWLGDNIYKLDEHVGYITIIALESNENRIFIDWIFDKFKDKFNTYGYNKYFMPRVLTLATNRGYFDLVKLLYNNKSKTGIKPNDDMYIGAVTYGHINILKWIIDVGLYISVETGITKAAENGHLDIIEFLYEYAKHNPYKRCNVLLNDSIFSEAVKNGHLHILKYIYNLKTRATNPIFIIKAIKFNYRRTIIKAINNNHFEIVKWMYEIICPSDLPSFRDIMNAGHLSYNEKNAYILTWLKENIDEHDNSSEDEEERLL